MDNLLKTLFRLVSPPWGAVSGFVISGLCIWLGFQTPDMMLGLALKKYAFVKYIFVTVGLLVSFILIFPNHAAKLWFTLYKPFQPPISWSFEGSFFGFSTFNREIGVSLFQGQAHNNTNRRIDDLNGYIESTVTHKKIPLYLNVGGDLYAPKQTKGIPPNSDFQFGSPFGPLKRGLSTIPLEEVLKDFQAFKFVATYNNGKRFEKDFSKEAVKKLVNEYKKIVFLSEIKKVELH